MFVFVVPGPAIETRSFGSGGRGGGAVKWTNVCEKYFKTSLNFNDNL